MVRTAGSRKLSEIPLKRRPAAVDTDHGRRCGQSVCWQTTNLQRWRRRLCLRLLSRTDELNRAAFTDGDRATSELLVNTFLEIGLDQVVGPHTAFVNVNRNFVLSDYCSRLPKDRVVLEIAGDAIVDERLIHGLSRLSLMGYSIALDNFVYRKELRPLLEIAKIVKIDALTLNDQGIVIQVNAAREFPVKLLAYKVETHDSYQYCKQLGFP